MVANVQVCFPWFVLPNLNERRGGGLGDVSMFRQVFSEGYKKKPTCLFLAIIILGVSSGRRGTGLTLLGWNKSKVFLFQGPIDHHVLLVVVVVSTMNPFRHGGGNTQRLMQGMRGRWQGSIGGFQCQTMSLRHLHNGSMRSGFKIWQMNQDNGQGNWLVWMKRRDGLLSRLNDLHHELQFQGSQLKNVVKALTLLVIPGKPLAKGKFSPGLTGKVVQGHGLRFSLCFHTNIG